MGLVIRVNFIIISASMWLILGDLSLKTPPSLPKVNLSFLFCFAVLTPHP